MALEDHALLPAAPYATYADYLARTGGILPEARAMSTERILAELRASGLRGRGGAGFPTAAKWASVAGHPCATRYVVCNAAEGEPGTFKDRWLLRANPYAVLEGMLIAAHAVAAREIIVAAKASFTKELARLRQGIAEIEAAGLLGWHELRVVEGPEEYLFGEEKALLEVVEGNDPLPREPHYPPYERGLFATPTSPNPALVNNAQTFAHVPSILRHGGASFAAIGTRDTRGTLLFTVSGDVQRPGVYELPAGITLEKLLHEVAGGPRPGRTIKAVLMGVSTAVIPADKLGTALDFGSMQLAGASLGSAGFVVIDNQTSMARVAQAVARFLYVESCNQCPACKNGLMVSSNALNEIFDPRRSTPDDLETALYGARAAPQGNRCYLPVQGSILIPSILHRFAPELDAIVADPAAAPAPWPIPKLVDFDEATRRFVYDDRQAAKQPNWTYLDA